MVTEPEIVLFDEPDSGLDPVRVAYLDELVVTAQKETGATFFIITHNIQSVMRTADYMGVLFRSNLVKFASKADMVATDNPIIQQFLAGTPRGPDRHGRDGRRRRRHQPLHRGRHGRAGSSARCPVPARSPWRPTRPRTSPTLSASASAGRRRLDNEFRPLIGRRPSRLHWRRGSDSGQPTTFAFMV